MNAECLWNKFFSFFQIFYFNFNTFVALEEGTF
jgi:hypothetical protein